MAVPPWIETDDGSYVIRVSRRIAADADAVWARVRDPAGYGTWSRTLSAQLDRLEVSQPITLAIRLFGDALPKTRSTERIELVDDAARAVGWRRDFALGQVTHRVQQVIPEADQCRYLTALQFSPVLGATIRSTLDRRLRAAFARFADELARVAEGA